ncbi:hypothetical protein Dsin_025461 [Dipteronia sinensis]|uniref:Uncharacterized protein n=1 Tax=Dipteronia sinensis TaxID=43782 RepID=A0AAD9ZWF9_9ROSI|nr:hypothetical protein Dsin_025461 [Dipteronia sinensis]
MGRSDERSRPYDRPPRNDSRQRTRVPEYKLSIEPSEALNVLKGMRNSVRWPPKMTSPPEHRDSNRWCKFHEEHGHRT